MTGRPMTCSMSSGARHDDVLLRAASVRRHLRRVGDALGGIDLCSYVDELARDPLPLRQIEQMVADEPSFRRKTWDSIYDMGLFRLTAFAVTRALRPAAFVETGVLHGLTSNVVLAAMKLNDVGTLWSIDLPSYREHGPANRDGFDDTLPTGREPGWAIPDLNRRHWKLIYGSSRDRLPELLSSLRVVDVFLHDSEHTYETMMFEMRTAWPHIRDDGMLICDNIECNSAFVEFAAHVSRDGLLLPELIASADEDRMRFGVIIK